MMRDVRPFSCLDSRNIEQCRLGYDQPSGEHIGASAGRPHGRLFGHHHHGAIPGDDNIFPKLMGDVVGPRREFIQDNSLTPMRLCCWGAVVQLLKN
jgi:hypothetical protein